MKTLIAIIFGLIAVSNLAIKAQTLTEQQVKGIAELVLQREHQINLPITKFSYDKKTDIWLCEQVDVVAPGLDIRIEVRDKDRYYKRIYGLQIAPKNNKFRLSPKLRKEILEIAPKK